MNRLKQAWQALRGELEPEVVHVFGPACVESVYCATKHHATAGPRRFYYSTCKQAHEKGLEVRKIEVIRADGRYFSRQYGLDEIVLQPKAGS